eukprot:13976-Prorocentrum_minimum.AAC.3
MSNGCLRMSNGHPIDIQSTSNRYNFDWVSSRHPTFMAIGSVRTMAIANPSTRHARRISNERSPGTAWQVVPAVNQVELHPTWHQKDLRAFCKGHNIHLSAYCPLGSPDQWAADGLNRKCTGRPPHGILIIININSVMSR